MLRIKIIINENGKRQLALPGIPINLMPFRMIQRIIKAEREKKAAEIGQVKPCCHIDRRAWRKIKKELRLYAPFDLVHIHSKNGDSVRIAILK